MTPPLIGVSIIAVFALAAGLAIWSRRDTKGRVLAIVLFLLATPAIWASTFEMLGHHRPLWSVYDMEAGDYHVLAARMIQDEAIYIYVLDPMRQAPRPLVMPWDNDTANAIQEAMDGAPEGKEGEFVLQYDPGLYPHEQQFHPIPQPPVRPPKPDREPGIIYREA